MLRSLSSVCRIVIIYTISLGMLYSDPSTSNVHRHRHHGLHHVINNNNNNSNNNNNNSYTKKYIIVESDGGLANRLRVLVSYYFIAKHYYSDYHLFMVWEVNDACPGHFLSIFQPIDDVTFITNTTRSILMQMHRYTDDDIISYPNTRDGFELTMEKLEIDTYLKHKHKIRNMKRYLWNQEKELWWSLMEPLHDIQWRAFQYAKEHDICNSSAIHIRRTDLWTELKSFKRTGYEIYDQWISQLPSNVSIYLMTDNPMTQQRFIEKYKQRIKVYNSISTTSLVNKPINVNVNINVNINNGNSNGGGLHSNNNTNTSGIKDIAQDSSSSSSSSSRSIIILNQTLDEYASPLSNSVLPIDYRYTTIEHALMDVLIASHAKYFHPAGYSSMSDFTKTMRTMHRWDYCDCQHRACFD